MKPIETKYKGYKFRSRLEARWAVFFDSLGLDWEYEKEGFDLGNGLYYLPDFYLPNLAGRKVWIEVKPDVPYYKDANKVLAFQEMIFPTEIIFVAIKDPMDGVLIALSQSDRRYDFAISIIGSLDGNQVVLAFFEGPESDSATLVHSGGHERISLERFEEIGASDFVKTAREAARSARFEHGQSG